MYTTSCAISMVKCLCCIRSEYSCPCSTAVVSAGIFRVFGQEVAEIPLVATSNDCQGKVSLQTCESHISYIFYA